MKTLIIATGPQGSGNHMWSKVFSQCLGITGWDQLTKDYWVGHGDEPFSNVWEDPGLFAELNWDDGIYYTSISCPYIIKGGPEMDQDGNGREPKYQQFIQSAIDAGFKVKVLVIGRDKNILECQQTRIRKVATTDRFLDVLPKLLPFEPLFISTELLYLYEEKYLNQISKLIDIPLNIAQDKLLQILSDNANAKYVKPISTYWLDDHMKNLAKTHGKTNKYKYNKGE